VVLRPVRADILCGAATALTGSAPQRAVAYAREAVSLDASREIVWLRLSAASQSAARAERDPAPRRRLFEEARDAARHAVRLVPSNAYAHAHLGTLLSDLERESPALTSRAEVEEAFARARALDPNNSFIQLAAATAALAAGDLEHAASWAGLCRDLYPRFAPPRALLGAAALAAGRGLALAGEKEQARASLERAVGLLREAQAAEWRGDDVARSVARANLDDAMRALAALD
jgi:tetratricopeptide (TPR) repeat protein